ncbi:FAD-dependent oxidoreductase, partial [Amycolatopsis alba DSM 44262]
PEDAPVLAPELELTGSPGTRAPHCWLDRDGERLSTIDLYFDDFVLLTGSRDSGWLEAADRAGKLLGVPVRGHVLAEGGDLRPEQGTFGAAHGVPEHGAVLVRPDAFVAWRTADSPATAEDALRAALAAATGRP